MRKIDLNKERVFENKKQTNKNVRTININFTGLLKYLQGNTI